MKKKIRVVQFGVGPIGASIVRLMRQKAALEIIGAIDKDPAKAGRDLGEIVGDAGAPWGVAISSDAEALLAKPVDVVIHSTSSYLPSVMDQLLACLAAGCCVVSTCEELSYPFRKHPELAEKLDAGRAGRGRRSGRHGSESRLRDGQAGADSERGRAARGFRESRARGGRIEAPPAAPEKNRRGYDTR